MLSQRVDKSPDLIIFKARAAGPRGVSGPGAAGALARAKEGHTDKEAPGGIARGFIVVAVEG